MQKKVFIGAIFAIALVVSVVSSACAPKKTTLTNPKTGDKITLYTDDKGTHVNHSHGPSGYIITPPRSPSSPTDGSGLHELYVRDYEKAGYVKDK